MKRNAHWVMVCVASVLACATLFAVFYGFQTWAWYQTRRMFREEPQLAIVPQPLKDTTVNAAEGKDLVCFGYRFEVSWNDVDRVDEGKTFHRIIFKSGRVLIFFDPKEKIDRVAVMQESRPLFGPEAMASNYNLEKTILSVTPDRVSLRMPRNEAMGNFLLLGFKTVEIRKDESGLYSIEGRDVRGFQKGEPSRDRVTFLDLFDDKDHEFELWIASDKQGKAKITQADLNRIIQTLRRVEEGK